jgi:hypothetical protein
LAKKKSTPKRRPISRKKNPLKKPLSPSSPLPEAFISAQGLNGPVLWALCGWALVAFFLLAVHRFHPIYHPNLINFGPEQWHPLLVIFAAGLGLMAWSFRSMPAGGDPSDDIGPTASRILLFLIMVLGACMRLYGADGIPANYWDDLSLPLNDACQVSEYHHFFIYGGYEPGEPLDAYCLALLLYFFPKWSGLFIQRLVATGFDLAALWVFYLLGKEFGKRRIGLLMASFGAVCKPQIILGLSYMRFFTVPAILGLALLLGLRLFKKPTLAHYMEWACAVALGYYTYTSYRPMGPYFIIAVLAWILLREKIKTAPYWNWFLGLGLTALVGFLFIYQHRFILNQSSPVRALVTNTMEKAWWIPLIWGLAILFAMVKVWRDARRGLTSWNLFYWALGVLLIVLLVAPILEQSLLCTRMSNLSVLSTNAPQPLFASLEILLNRTWLTVKTLFYSGGDRYDMNLMFDSFFGVADAIFILPGLLYILVRPTWPKMFILLAGLVGLAPHILADPGGSRLSDCITPFLLAGALGFNQILEAGAGSSGSRFWKGALLALWVGLLAFGTYSTFEKLYFHFMNRDAPQVVFARQITKDSAHSRVYLADFEGFLSEQVLNENNTVYRFSTDSNAIYLGPDEPKPDVVVLFKTNQIPKPGIIEEFKAQFPGSQWENIPIYPWSPGDTTQMVRAFIPGDQLPESGTTLFHVVRTPAVRWTRKLYSADYRVGYGVVLEEDRVENLADPYLFPTNYYGLSTGRFETIFNAPEDGLYRFSVETDYAIDLWVGDQDILRLRPFGRHQYSGTIRLTQGNHPLRFMSFSPVSNGIPHFTVTYPNGEAKPLL